MEDLKKFKEEAKRTVERGRQKEDAARRILEIAAELRLTWVEFEQTLEIVREMAYLSPTSVGTTS